MNFETKIPVDHLIISDLHLADGQNPSSKSWSRYEQFFYDTVFAQFLEHQIAEARRVNKRIHLLLLGDIFDFAHTPGLSSIAHKRSVLNQGTARIKLEKIFAGHVQFFAALGSFISAGHPISILPGNHDAALVLTDIQGRLLELVGQYSPSQNPADLIHFYPWFYYLPGVLYAEHGQQYHDINAFTTMLKPYSPWTPTEIELTLGGCLDESLIELVFQVSPQPEIRGSVLGTLLRTYFNQPRSLFASRRILWHFISTTLRILATRSSPATRSRRRTYWKETLPVFAEQTGFSSNTLETLDRLSQVSNWNLFQRILKTTTSRGSHSPKEHYLFLAAQRIYTHLQVESKNVPFYVFGHSHQHRRIRLFDQPDTGGEFLNTGSWAAPPFISPEAARERRSFPFVQISQPVDGRKPQAKLLTWDATQGTVEPVG